MGIDSGFLWFGLGIILLALIGVLIGLWLWGRRSRERVEQLASELETLKQTVGALCSSAVAVDRRVNSIDRRGRDLEERQESIETQHQIDPPYADAIRMVKEGADADKLVRELGLSHGAADLILMIHGMKDGVRPLD